MMTLGSNAAFGNSSKAADSEGLLRNRSFKQRESIRSRIKRSGVVRRAMASVCTDRVAESTSPAGSQYMLVAGALAFGCCLLDFNWSSPAFPRRGDPYEAQREASALFRISRYLAALLGASYLIFCGISVAAIQLRVKAKESTELTLLIGAVLLGDAVWSNCIAGERYYSTTQWSGPNWYYTTLACAVSVLSCFLSWFHVTSGVNHRHNGGRQAKLEEALLSPPEGLSPLLCPESEKQTSSNICKSVCLSLCACTTYVTMGVLLLLLATLFYSTQPEVSLYGSLRSHQSFLEWHKNGGRQAIGDVANVYWSPDAGIQVMCSPGQSPPSHGGEAQPCWQSPGGSKAFLVSSLSSESTLLRAKTTSESGVFSVRDEPGTLSTEQVVESIDVSPDQSTITFTGYLYYGPFVASVDKSAKLAQGPAWRSFFSFGISAKKSVKGVVMLELNATVDASTNDRVYLLTKSPDKERIFGMGESYSFMDLKGGVVPVITREQGIGRGLEPLSMIFDILPGVPSGTASQFTYSAIPHFTTTLLRSIAVAGTEMLVMDFSRPGEIVIEANGTSLQTQLFKGPSPASLVQAYTEEVSGVMRPLPEWVGQGAVLGLQGGKEVVQKKLQKFLDSGVPVTAIWLQDWSGQRDTMFGQRLDWNWQVDTELYPGWTDWLDELFQKHGISVLSYINPYLAQGGDMFKAADAAGCLLSAKGDGEPLVQTSATPDFRFGTIDLFREECKTWYIHVIRKNMIGVGGSSATARVGVMGWMADFAESIPFDTTYGSAAHNAFPGLWAETCRRAIDEDDYSKNNIVYFTRSANAQTPRFSTLQWMGDQLTSWDSRDGLHSALIAQMSAGLSGLAYSNSDVGGYTMVKRAGLTFVRDTELLKRWAESSAFADSMFRTHEGLLPDASAQAWDSDVLPHFARFATIFKLMWPIRKAVQENEPGLPIMRSMWMHFADDPKTASLKTQFLVAGKDIIVCPVLAPGRNFTSCYIPKGLIMEHVFDSSSHYDTKATNSPKTVKCPAKIGEPCVLFSSMNAKLMDLAKTIRATIQITTPKPTSTPTPKPTPHPSANANT